MILETRKIKKILVISAHVDDMEFGCGGTVAKLIEQGAEVYNLALSLRKTTVPKDFPEKELIKEAQQAAKTLSLRKENLIIKDFPNRIFPAIRQDILDTFCFYAKKIKPDLVFTTSLDDMHQDHRVVAEESFRAFKHTNIIAYGFAWNRIKHTINIYSVIEERHLRKKIKSLQSYQSQIKGRPYFTPGYIRSLAITQGTIIKRKYAECLELIRWIF